ncbi:MAG: class I SAM-dependent methyltransferase [Methanoculleus sp.]|nr:class I SAM-dependent methyltransferase [Methanoculleus sp.]
MDGRGYAWDSDYRRRGDLWGGAPVPLPDLPAGAAVLELGCGNGKTLAALAQQPWSVIAADISPHAIDRARASPGSAAARFVVAGAACLPFHGGVFDAVFLIHIVGHLLEPGRRAMASEVLRVLRPGGKVFFRAFSVEDMRAGKGAEVEPQTFCRGNGIITHYFTETEVMELFTPFEAVSAGTCRREMRVRGRGLPRAEIEAVFRKAGSSSPAGSRGYTPRQPESPLRPPDRSPG